MVSTVRSGNVDAVLVPKSMCPQVVPMYPRLIIPRQRYVLFGADREQITVHAEAAKPNAVKNLLFNTTVLST
jgi:hypothetical protein